MSALRSWSSLIRRMDTIRRRMQETAVLHTLELTENAWLPSGVLSLLRTLDQLLDIKMWSCSLLCRLLYYSILKDKRAWSNQHRELLCHLLQGLFPLSDEMDPRSLARGPGFLAIRKKSQPAPPMPLLEMQLQGGSKFLVSETFMSKSQKQRVSA